MEPLPPASASRAGDRQRRSRPAPLAVYAVALTLLVGLLFTGVTALTLTMWATDPHYVETNPVVDLAFFALGGILVTLGVAAQVRARRIVGLQQAAIALAALALVGGVAGRVEPLVGGLLLLALLAPLALGGQERRRVLAARDRRHAGTTAALAAVAALPATIYAAGMIVHARAAGPACFLGQCALGDRYAEAGALAVALFAIALRAGSREPGSRLAAGSAGAAAMLFGSASLAFPGEVGAVGAPWATATIAWGLALLVLAYRGRDGARGAAVSS